MPIRSKLKFAIAKWTRQFPCQWDEQNAMWCWKCPGVTMKSHTHTIGAAINPSKEMHVLGHLMTIPPKISLKNLLDSHFAVMENASI